MIKFLLYILEKIPYRTSFGMTLADELKEIYYKKIGQFKKPERCLCGGIILTHTWFRSEDDASWETTCQSCDHLYDED
jgi:hypothetical protein